MNKKPLRSANPYKKDQVVRYYDETHPWVSRYSDLAEWLAQTLIEHNLLRPIKVLEIGSGGGELALSLAQEFKKLNVLFQIRIVEPSALMRARPAHRKAIKLESVCHCDHNFPHERCPCTDGTYDVVIALLSLHHIPRYMKCLDHLIDRSKSGLCIVTGVASGDAVLVSTGTASMAPDHQAVRFWWEYHSHLLRSRIPKPARPNELLPYDDRPAIQFLKRRGFELCAQRIMTQTKILSYQNLLEWIEYGALSSLLALGDDLDRRKLASHMHEWLNKQSITLASQWRFNGGVNVKVLLGEKKSLDDDVAKRIQSQLGDLGARALKQLLLLQQPWGEFREFIPQSIETLASRGRTAMQYQFVPKPKVFASFEVYRTLRTLLDGAPEPAKALLVGHHSRVIGPLTDYLKRLFQQGVRPGTVRNIAVGDSIWVADWSFKEVPSHVDGPSEIELKADIRHTAEALHFLLQYGGCEFTSRIVDATSQTYKSVCEALIAVANETRFAPEDTPTVVHLVNFLLFLKVKGLLNATSSAVLKRLKEKLINLQSQEKGYWITGPLGPIWGTSFVLNLLGANLPDENRTKALDSISNELSVGPVEPGNDEKLLEVNIQGFLALAKAQYSLSQRYHRTLSNLLPMVRIESMELGELCELVQLACHWAPEDLWQAIQSNLPAELAEEDKAEVFAAGIAEHLEYAAMCQFQIKRYMRAEPCGFSEASNGAKKRIERCATALSAMSLPRAVRDAVDEFEITLTSEAGINERIINTYEKLISALMYWLRREVYYPKMNWLLSLADCRAEVISVGGGQVPRHAEETIRKIWLPESRPISCEPLSGGRSNTELWLTASESGWPRVVKCGNKRIILSEVNRYRRSVSARLPLAPLLFGPENFGNTYALGYEFPVLRGSGGAHQNRDLVVTDLRRIIEGYILGKDNGHLLSIFERSLNRAIFLRYSWPSLNGERFERPFISFAPETDGWYRLKWNETTLLQNLSESAGLASKLIPHCLIDIAQINNAIIEAKESCSDCGLVIHGDFHAGNIVVVLNQKKKDMGPRVRFGLIPYDPKMNHTFAAVMLIDFANVMERGILEWDLGKFLRDLRERFLASSIQVPQNGQESDRIRLQNLYAYDQARIEDPHVRRAVAIRSKAESCFAKRCPLWHRGLLLHELMYFYSCFTEYAKHRGITKDFECWSSCEAAIASALLGMQYAVSAMSPIARPLC